MALSTFMLDFCMQFVDVIANTQQENLKFYFGFPPQQKSLEFVITFQNTKSSFYLNGTVHPIFDSPFTQNIFVGFLPLLQKTFGNI